MLACPLHQGCRLLIAIILMTTSGLFNTGTKHDLCPFLPLQIVADFMTIGLYNTNMERHAYPFLPEEPEGLEGLKLSHQLQVADVMTPKIVAMPVVIRCACVFTSVLSWTCGLRYVSICAQLGLLLEELDRRSCAHVHEVLRLCQDKYPIIEFLCLCLLGVEARVFKHTCT